MSLNLTQMLNSLAPGRSECDSKNVIFNLVLLIGIFRSSHDNAFWWMPQELTDDKSILVQVMAWCCQATSHYLSQCWFSSLSPYGVVRPQWVNNSWNSPFLMKWISNAVALLTWNLYCMQDIQGEIFSWAVLIHLFDGIPCIFDQLIQNHY